MTAGGIATISAPPAGGVSEFQILEATCLKPVGGGGSTTTASTAADVADEDEPCKQKAVVVMAAVGPLPAEDERAVVDVFSIPTKKLSSKQRKRLANSLGENRV